MKNCIICNEEGKYKCPICLVYYCSATCCKKHREIKCDVLTAKVAKRPEDEVVEFPSEDTVPVDKLKLLGHDKELKTLLENPHLKDLLKTVDSSNNPQEMMQKAMMEPLFVEFADACLKVIEPSDGQET